jgi:hypothetical protein
LGAAVEETELPKKSFPPLFAIRTPEPRSGEPESRSYAVAVLRLVLPPPASAKSGLDVSLCASEGSLEGWLP